MSETMFEEIDLEAELKKAEEEAPVAEEAEAEKEATEETGKAEEETEKTEEKEVPRIPLPELQAERKKRQAAEAATAEEREKYARLDERLNILNEKMNPKEAVPDYNEDPFEHLRQTGDQTGQSVEDLQKRVEGLDKQNEEVRYRNELTNRVVSSENVFRQDHPDYDEAVGYLRNGRAQEYIAMGISDPAQIEQALGNEAFQLAQTAMQNGMSTAEMAYNIAKSRGYAPKSKTDKLETIQKGQEKSTSLSNAGGSEERTLDIEALAEMDDADFAKAVEGGNWDKMMKGT